MLTVTLITISLLTLQFLVIVKLTIISTVTVQDKLFDLRDVSISVQSEGLRGVCAGQVTDVVHVLLHLGTLGDDVALVEAEVALEHVLSKPDFTEGVEQPLVVVVCHTATILNLTKHVADTGPVHSL